MTASVHRRTPALRVSDSRGLPIRQIAYLRTIAGETTTALMTRQQHDAAGRLVAQWGPRLSKPNLTTVYELAGEPLKVDSVDAGWRLNLPGLAGETRRRWDARGNHWRTTYDDQLRVVTVEENAQPDVETFTYADAVADAHHNLRGQLLEQVDPSGTLRLESYGLLGQPLRETRTFHDAQAFASRRTYSPLGAVLDQVDAGEHRQQSRYDLAGQLQQVQLQINGQHDWQPVLQKVQYNAAGKIIEQQAGNDVISRWSYDPADARLLRQRAQKDQQPALQDFEYVYDPVGNITRILDHVFTPSHFANQRVDGHREFSYDSLYRLHSASGYDDGPPSDTPGLPQPTDPNDRRNYTQTYEYDHSDNLIKLRHVREGATHTRQMFIDSASNRGVRWTEGDPDPQFDTLFDRHGNLQALQPGQGLRWNARDQLASVTLVRRDDGPNDEEQYRYSQGARVYKRHETHTATTSHFHEVRYLPGLEIRTRDNGEVLHVIILGGLRCLHWLAGKPPGIDADQLRYKLDDQLGSSLMELDQQARLISHEGYYPFGATAWMVARSALEVSYKTVRYSGKEMDVSGLYYYGARYYAPWLQRWVSADPAGDVDGLNLYGFVGNNPINFIDSGGTTKEKPADDRQDIQDYTKVLEVLGLELQAVNVQLNNLFSKTDIAKRLGVNAAYNITKASVKTVASEGVKLLLPNVPLIPTVASALTGKVVDKLSVYKNFSTPVLPDTKKLVPESIHTEATVGVFSKPLQYTKNFIKGYDLRTQQGREKLSDIGISFALGQGGVPAPSEVMAIAHSARDAAKATIGLQTKNIEELRSALVLITELLEQDRSDVNAAFSRIGINEFYPAGLMNAAEQFLDLAAGNVGTDQSRTVRRDQIQKTIDLRVAEANRGLELIRRYTEYNS
ncbi:RHS repeat-associated core domain-containing protein [Pseudomonas cucumis]|uniref:RHS repeat-associated core domain-containing protein n=1 Tax=Pseudomonas cucumis TaxID=2954082 RepID=UPI002735C828|nr:RHS repeat-associated core domain-containing protein [Pseudomonas cucumis]WLG89276.1 RHS repeat-associated core domain-containing protein [Pseudomonas cucumis]